MQYLNFYKDTSGVSWDIAHLYEHAVLHGFNKLLVSRNLLPYLECYIKGEVFESGAMFISGIFYSLQVSELFAEYVKNPSTDNSTYIQALRQVEVEERVIAKNDGQISDSKQLLILNERNFLNLFDIPLISDSVSLSAEKEIELSQAIDAYGELSIVLSISRPTKNDIALLNRFCMFIADGISYELQQNYCTYTFDSNLLEENNEQYSFSLKVICKKDLDENDVREVVDKVKKVLQNPKHIKRICESTELWANDPSKQDVKVDYFRCSGVTIGNKGLLKLVTLDNIVKILKNIECTTTFVPKIAS